MGKKLTVPQRIARWNAEMNTLLRKHDCTPLCAHGWAVCACSLGKKIRGILAKIRGLQDERRETLRKRKEKPTNICGCGHDSDAHILPHVPDDGDARCTQYHCRCGCRKWHVYHRGRACDVCPKPSPKKPSNHYFAKGDQLWVSDAGDIKYVLQVVGGTQEHSERLALWLSDELNSVEEHDMKEGSDA